MGRLGLLAGVWEGFWYRPRGLSGGQKPSEDPEGLILLSRARGREGLLRVLGR